MNSRNIALIILGILTLLLGAASIYIGLQVSTQDQAPVDTSASSFSCGSIVCVDGSEAGYDCNSAQSCSARVTEFCNSVGSTPQDPSGNPISAGDPVYDQFCVPQTGGCTYSDLTFDSSSDCMTLASDSACSSITVKAYHEFASNTASGIPASYGHPDHCFTSSNEYLITITPGQTLCPKNDLQWGCGSCVQYDAVDDSGNDIGGVSDYTGACETVGCNQSCGNGVANCSSGLECISGVCRNPDEPTSTTCTITPQSDPGTISITPFCTEGNESKATISWVPGTGMVNRYQVIDVDDDADFDDDGYWNKDLEYQSTSTVVPDGLSGVLGQSGSLSLTAGVTYFVRVFDSGSDSFYDTQSFVAEECITPGCGEPCTIDDQCPNDHTCYNGICTLDTCVGNLECTNNGCVLPDTALFDENTSKLLIGITFLLTALVLTQINIFDTPKYLKTISKESLNKVKSLIPESEKKSRFGKSRDSFEKRFKK